MESRCLNCGAEVNGAFCAQCGQKKTLSGIRMKDVVNDFFSYSFSIDGPVWRTLRLLVLNPGKLFHEFIEGRRKSYYKPIQFFVLTALIYFAFAEIIGFDPLKDQFASPAPEKAQPYMEHIRASAQFMVKNVNNFLFLQVLSIAVVLKTLHWNRHTMAEYLAVGFYVSGFYLLIGLLDLVGSLFELSSGQFKLFLFPLYFTHAYVSFRAKLTWSTVVLGLISSIAIFIIYMVMSFGLSLLWVAL